MSIAVTAVELKPDADLFQLTAEFSRVMTPVALQKNTEELLKKTLCLHDDKAKPNLSFESFYSCFRKAKEDHSIYTASMSFSRFEGRMFALRSGLWEESREFFCSNPIVAPMVIQDLSFYNSSDSQVADGLITEEEWRERSKLWHRFLNSKNLRDNPFLKFSLDEMYIMPSWAGVVEYSRTAPEATVEARREALAKRMVADEAIALSLKEEGDASNFMRAYLDVVQEGYPGWRAKLELIPELPPIS